MSNNLYLQNAVQIRLDQKPNLDSSASKEGPGDSRFDRASTYDTTCELRDSSSANRVRSLRKCLNSRRRSMTADDVASAALSALIERRYRKMPINRGCVYFPRPFTPCVIIGSL